MAEGRRGLSLRARLVLLTTAGLAVGLLVGGIALTVILRAGLERASDNAARQTAGEVVALIAGGRLPDPIPAGGTTVVQVVDEQGRVLAASVGADRLVPAIPADVRTSALAGPITMSGSAFGIQGPVRVVASAAGTEAEPTTVVVAAPAGDIDQAVGVVRISLIAGFAVLLAVLAAIAWRLIGATLRPVEALRVSAERITGTGSAGSLPLPRSHDEIRRLAQTLNDMLGRLADSRKRQRSFVADAAHELRSPLTSLRTQLEVAAATGDEPVAADLLAEVDRLTALVNDLLLLARVDDAQPPQLQRVDLAALTQDCVQRFSTARVPVTLTMVSAPVVRGEPMAVDRVLVNVLDNAVRYASSAVAVAVSSTPQGAELVVTDDGPGVPSEDRGRILERFTRLDDARDRDTGGSGLGLAIVDELVRQLGGSVSLGDARDGVDNPGLRLQIRFPPMDSTAE